MLRGLKQKYEIHHGVKIMVWAFCRCGLTCATRLIPPGRTPPWWRPPSTHSAT